MTASRLKTFQWIFELWLFFQLLGLLVLKCVSFRNMLIMSCTWISSCTWKWSNYASVFIIRLFCNATTIYQVNQIAITFQWLPLFVFRHCAICWKPRCVNFVSKGKLPFTSKPLEDFRSTQFRERNWKRSNFSWPQENWSSCPSMWCKITGHWSWIYWVPVFFELFS